MDHNCRQKQEAQPRPSETKRERALRLAREAGAWDSMIHDCAVIDEPNFERFYNLARAEVFEEAWDAISAMIKEGPLPEHKSNERNGLILAANAVAELKDKVERDAD